MSKQEISVLMETLSFFFVGIDLYGQERLRKMQENFLLISERINVKVTNFQDYEWNKNRKSKFMKRVYVITGAITLIILAVIATKIKSDLNAERFSDWKSLLLLVLSIIFGGGMIFGFTLLVILMALVIILIALMVLMRVINWILRGVMWAFRFYQIEGVFLFIGTMLFLTSKYFQLY